MLVGEVCYVNKVKFKDSDILHLCDIPETRSMNVSSCQVFLWVILDVFKIRFSWFEDMDDRFINKCKKFNVFNNLTFISP